MRTEYRETNGDLEIKLLTSDSATLKVVKITYTQPFTGNEATVYVPPSKIDWLISTLKYLRAGHINHRGEQ